MPKNEMFLYLFSLRAYVPRFLANIQDEEMLKYSFILFIQFHNQGFTLSVNPI